MSSLYSYPDFFDPIFDAVPRSPEPERDFREWYNAQRAEMVPAFYPEARDGRGVMLRFTAEKAPFMRSIAETPLETEALFMKKAREYWEANVRQ